MHLGKVLAWSLVPAAVMAADHRKKPEMDCSLPKIKQTSDIWVKSHVQALEACAKEPFDRNGCLKGLRDSEAPQRKLEACIALHPELDQESYIEKSALSILLLQDLTNQVIEQQVAAEKRKAEMLKRAHKSQQSVAAKNYSRFVYHREL